MDKRSIEMEDMTVTESKRGNSSLKGMLRWLWKQLNRDLGTFLPADKQQPKEDAQVQLGGPRTLRTPASVDPTKLVKLQSRRAILDWRDGFHIRITQRAQILRDTFLDEINKGLDRVGIIERFVAKRASDILQDPFIRTVRVPLFQFLTEEEEGLNAVLRELGARRQFDHIFERDWSASECAKLGDIRFKSANHEKIRLAVDALILGQSGIVRPFLAQADRIAQIIIDEELKS